MLNLAAALDPIYPVYVDIRRLLARQISESSYSSFYGLRFSRYP